MSKVSKLNQTIVINTYVLTFNNPKPTRKVSKSGKVYPKYQ